MNHLLQIHGIQKGSGVTLLCCLMSAPSSNDAFKV